MIAATLIIASMVAQASHYAEIDFTTYDVDESDYVFLDFQIIIGRVIHPATIGTSNLSDLPRVFDFLFSDFDDDGELEYRIVGRKVRIFGIRERKGGALRPIRYVSLRTRGFPYEKLPIVRNPAPEPGIISLARVPIDRKIRLAFEVASIHNDITAKIPVTLDAATNREERAKRVVEEFAAAGVKAEAKGHLVYVQGLESKGKTVPAPRVGVSCPDLAPTELPGITAWPIEPCVVLDLSGVRRDPVRGGKFIVEIPTTSEDGVFREEFLLGGQFDIKEVARKLVQRQFKIEVEGEVIRVYGWQDFRRKLHSPTDIRVTSRDLKPSEVPIARVPWKPSPKSK